MKINKRQVLSLIKILSHYNSLTMIGSNYSVVNDVEYLIEELEDFILDELEEEQDSFIGAGTFNVGGEVGSKALVSLKPSRGRIVTSVVGNVGDNVTFQFNRVIKDCGEIDTYLAVVGDKDEMIGPLTYVRLYDHEFQVATGEGHECCWNYFDLEMIPSDWHSQFGKAKSYLRMVKRE